MASKKIACQKFAVLCQLHLLCSPPKKLKAAGHVPALYRAGYTEAGSPNCTLSIWTMFNYNCPQTNTGSGFDPTSWKLASLHIRIELSEVPHLRSEQCILENVSTCAKNASKLV